MKYKYSDRSETKNYKDAMRRKNINKHPKF